MTDPLLSGKGVILGVTGGIAAYKAADLCSKLAQAGAEVDVILTDAAVRFVAPLTFAALSGRAARVDMWIGAGGRSHPARQNGQPGGPGDRGAVEREYAGEAGVGAGG